MLSLLSHLLFINLSNFTTNQCYYLKVIIAPIFIAFFNIKIYKLDNLYYIRDSLGYQQTPAMKNFTALYLHRLNRKLLDDSGVHIMTIKYSDEENDNYYIPPSLEYDIMEDKTRLKTPILRESKDLIELRESGIILCSQPVTTSTQFRKKQTEYLFLTKIGHVPIGAIIVNTLNSNGNRKGQHRFIFDDANKIVKLAGPYAGPMGEGPWIQID